MLSDDDGGGVEEAVKRMREKIMSLRCGKGSETVAPYGKSGYDICLLVEK